ncbi:PucR family transcriptional regulator [Pectinatus frisingensis]|uniref:PucR family transcriptional regulator n=1 Tax=Pectinatus frisingensis TaxID=865 RepID=UPI0015F6ADAD|nr:PucR family transcriptional regulator [Pectinatus frisingensis]
MAVRCTDLLKLEIFCHLKLLGGKDGLDRIVRCPYVTLTKTIAQWVHGGELMFVSVKDLSCNAAQLLQLFNEGYQKNLSGVVLLVETVKNLFLDDLITAADCFCLPLFQMPYELPLVEITEEISSFIIQDKLRLQFTNELMIDIFSAQKNDQQSLISKAMLYHYDISGAHRIAIISINNLQSIFQENNFLLVKKSLIYMESLQGIVDAICKKRNWNVPGFINGNMLVLLLPATARAEIEKMLMEIYGCIEENLDNPRIFISIGKEYSSLSQMRRSHLEAKRANSFTTGENKHIIFYEDLGFYKVLYEINNQQIMTNFSDEVLLSLKRYDKENHTVLMHTLMIYLYENCNLVKTAKKLYIHRNSLIYRIKKIEEITKESLDNENVCEKYRQALWVEKFLISVNHNSINE